MDDKNILKLSANVVVRKILDEALIFPVSSEKGANCCYSLNQTAGDFILAVNGKRSLGDIKGIFLKKYDVSRAVLDKEVREFLVFLNRIKALIQ